MDIGVHMLDMALHLLGEPEVTAATAATYAEFGPRGQGASAYGPCAKTDGPAGDFDVEDLSTAFLRLDGGGTLLLESSWAQWIPHDQCYVTVYGSEGGASIEWGGDPATRTGSWAIWTEKDGVPAELHPMVPPDGSTRRRVLDFLAKVRSGDFAEHRGRRRWPGPPSSTPATPRPRRVRRSPSSVHLSTASSPAITSASHK